MTSYQRVSDQESERHREVREALVARRGPAIGELIIMGADTTWSLRNVVLLLRRVEGLTEEAIEFVVRPISDNASRTTYELLCLASENAGVKVTDAMSKDWMDEIESLCRRYLETETTITKTLYGDKGGAPQ